MKKKPASNRPSRKPQSHRTARDNAADFGEASSSPVNPWQTFLQAHPHCAAQYSDEIYAIPEGLIDAIKTDVPKLLGPKDEIFERDLTRLSGLGFSLGQPIVFPALEHAQQPTGFERIEAFSNDRLEKSSASLRKLIDNENRLDGRNPIEIQTRNAEAQQRANDVRDRQLGYVGWLMTNPDFRSDRDAFRAKWGQRICHERRFPTIPVSFFGENLPQIKKSDREFFADYSSFYRSWGIDRLAGWELPCPMRPGIDTPSLYPSVENEGSGLVVFVPWYLLRHKDLKLTDLADSRGMPPHLKDWIDGGEPLGVTRSAVMLEVYLYLELAIKRRYRQRLHRKAEALDRALSRYFQTRSGKAETPDRKAESIKKIRSEMRRRLSF